MKKSEYLKTIFIIAGIVLVLGGGFMLLIVLLSLTVKNVKQTDYAVGYDNYTMAFTKVYTQGQYVTKVGETLIVLPRTLQEFSTSLLCLTSDKVLVTLDVAMQFQYEKSELINTILKKFNGKKNYNKFIENRATSSIMDTCLQYTAEQYYTERSNIDIQMYNNLVKIVNNKHIGSNIEFFQLVNIEFPQSFSNVVTQKQNVQQDALTATNNRQSILTNAYTVLYEAQRIASITLINANNTATININKAMTNAGAQQELWNKRAYAYSYTANILGLNGSEIIDYIENDNIRNSVKLITSSK